MKQDFQTGERIWSIEERLSNISSYGTHVSVGFWMRRMADDTERPLYRTLEQVIRQFDPEFARKLETFGP